MSHTHTGPHSYTHECMATHKHTHKEMVSIRYMGSLCHISTEIVISTYGLIHVQIWYMHIYSYTHILIHMAFHIHIHEFIHVDSHITHSLSNIHGFIHTHIASLISHTHTHRLSLIHGITHIVSHTQGLSHSPLISWISMSGEAM